MKRVCVIGEGAWGTAVATLLAANGYAVNLWCHDADVCQTIATQHKNERYLPGIQLSEKIEPTIDLTQAVCDVTWIFEAIPVKFLRSVLEQARTCFDPQQVWVILSKGIEQKTLMFPSQMVDAVFDHAVNKAIFAGPSFAHDLANKQITAVTIAATDCAIGLALQQMLANDYFRPYISLDMIGVQVGAALKNVIALGIGILDGAGFTDNAKAFIFTRGLHEMVKLARALGGKQETLYGLSGVGDLVLTSMGKLSRNLAVGRRLGQGDDVNTILRETGYIPEGINTVQSVHQLLQKNGLDLPICDGIYQIIFEHKPLHEVITALMQRPLEQECMI